jgi:predicted dehydrogenase
MALTVAECDAMITAAEKSPGKFMIAQCIRFWPQYVYLRKVFQDKTFGRLSALHLRRQAESPDYTLDRWSIKEDLSGGAVLDLHVHDVDYALQLLGKPKSVFAQGYSRTGAGVDRIHASWQYEADRVVQLEGYWDVPETSGFGFNMGFTAVFEGATVHWDSASGRPLSVYRERSEPEVPEISGQDGYYGEIDYFLGCIERNEDPTVSTPTESREAVAVALAEKQSAKAGELVAIS